ncbi:MAG: septal ring lytic transglycosylase RlpA family protein, partial [Spirochaetaceae bacterium]
MRARFLCAVVLAAILTPVLAFAQTEHELDGLASWYGGKFQGRLTANGEVFDTNQLTAAHRTLPFGTIVRVINPVSEQQVVVRINDRGPFVEGRVIDLSRA